MEDYMGFRPTLAIADILGSEKYPEINGRVIFKKKGEGVLVTVEIMGLPTEDGKCNRRVFGFQVKAIIFQRITFIFGIAQMIKMFLLQVVHGKL